LPDKPDGRALWRALGRAGRIEKLYTDTRSGPEVCPEPLTGLIRELDGSFPTGVVLAVCPQIAVALPLLGSAAALKNLWRSSVAGDTMTAVAATDGDAAGSDLLNLTTFARISDDGVTVDGHKRWVTAGAFADHVLVLARHTDGDHFTSFTWVLVPADAPGVTVEPVDTPFFEGSGVAHLRFDGVRITRDQVVGRVGYGMAAFARHMGTERFVSATWAAALCRRVVAGTYDRMAGRSLRGEPLWHNGSVRQSLARCLVEVSKLDAVCAQGPSSVAAGMVLKIAAADTVSSVLTTCAQLWGADGFDRGGVHWLRAEAAMFGSAGGATEALLAGLADQIPGLLRESPW
jgi:citronellyl-CoA dehydrogenase